MRRVLRWLLVLNGVLLPLSCIPALLLFNSVNTMELAFITAFTVENRSPAPIYVTPIGTVGREGRKWPLPLVIWQAPWVPASQRAHFLVPNGQSITLNYDWDDINFSELVVEEEGRGLQQLVVNPNPTANQYTIPPTTHFVIGAGERLGPVDPKVREAYETARHPTRWLLILAGTTAPLISFILLRRWYRRIRIPPAEAAA
jgi:hypothetical protein